MQALAGRPVASAGVCRMQASLPTGRTFIPVLAKEQTRVARVAERHRRLRNKLSGTAERPRMCVFRSNQHIYAQVIDDTAAGGQGLTLAMVSTQNKDIKAATEGNGKTQSAAEMVGKAIADLCLKKNITKVCFDRGGFVYHGRVQSLAEGARAGGLDF